MHGTINIKLCSVLGHIATCLVTTEFKTEYGTHAVSCEIVLCSVPKMIDTISWNNDDDGDNDDV